MAYRRKDSPVWWVGYIDQRGKRVRRSTGTEDRAEAEALESKWKLEAYRARQWEEQPSRSFEELMLAYLEATAGERRLKSEETVRMRVRRLSGHFAGQVMDQLNGADIGGYIRARKADGVSNSTINRELEVLSAAITYAVREWEWRLPNPVSGRMLREPQDRLRWLTRAQAAALLRAAEAAEAKAPNLAPLITLALHTGTRRGELLGLEWARVDLAAQQIYLEADHTKTARRRTVPRNAVARGAILQQARFRAEQCPDSPWVFATRRGARIASVKTAFNHACARAGIDDFRFHDLRHTCAAWLVQAGVPLTEVRDVLGHSTIKMTERYAHLAPENTRADPARLEAPESRSGHAKEKGLRE